MGLEQNIEYQMGKLDGRVAALENRADTQERTLIVMDGKLDQILTAQSKSDGGKDQMSALVRNGVAFLAAIGSVGALAFAALHYFLTGRN